MIDWKFEWRDALLELGCGSADLLAYDARGFQACLGVDFSPSTLAAARRRLDRFGAGGVHPLQTDAVTVWDRLGDASFAAITAGQRVQDLGREQV